VTVDQLSFSFPDPSSGESTVLMIYNPHPGTVNLGVGLFPYLMGTFEFPPPLNDIKFISVVPDQPKVSIFQVTSCRMNYFNDPWNLASPSASMEGVGHPGMVIPLSITEVMYIIVKKTLTNSDPTPPQVLDSILEPILAQESLNSHDPLDLVLPSNEAILEAMMGLNRPWDDLHHRSYFLPELRRVEAGEFTSTMNGVVTHPFNPLEMHRVYAEGNMENTDETIPIDITKTPGVIENVFIGVDCSLEEIQVYIELFREFRDIFFWSYEEMPVIDPRIVEHKIRTYLNSNLVQHKPHLVNPQKAVTIKVEVEKLIKDGFIYQVQLMEWNQNMFLSIKIKVQFECHCSIF
jgi:hypothetical protein